jgi:hypothetical protein
MTRVSPPKYPVGELATFELRDYRHQLETALAELPEQAPLHQVYAGKLTKVISEQEDRSCTTGLPAKCAGA